MYTAIHKYTIAVHKHTIVMPVGARILCVQNQRGDICLWAEVCPEGPTEERTFIVRGTGWEYIPVRDEVYLGTVQVSDGALVWHVFETTQRDA